MVKFIEWNLSGIKGNSFSVGIKRAESTAREMARDAGQLLVAELKKLAPVGTHYDIEGDTVTESRPETLKKSIHFKTRQMGHDRVELMFYAAEHIKYVIYPTRPHWIIAKNKKFLRFYWPDAPAAILEKFPSGIVFFKKVFHPGTRGNNFPQQAMTNKWAELQQITKEAAERVQIAISQFRE